MAFAATSFACTDGWASRAVVSLARAWAEEGRRIFLMDLGLESPSVHKVLDLPNGEGVSDAFLYGASVQHIAQSAMGGAFFFASAGTLSADPEEVLTHSRWNDLASGFSEADATLILFIPTQVPGADRILSLATDLVFLAGQGESLEANLGPAAVKTVAVLGPMGEPPEPGFGGAFEEPPSPVAEVVEVDEGIGERFGLAPEFPTREMETGPEWDLAGHPEGAMDTGSARELTPQGDDGLVGEVTPGSEPIVPDFEPEFADLPPLEGERARAEGVGFGGDDLVRGSDFGEPVLPAPEEPPGEGQESGEAGGEEREVGGEEREPAARPGTTRQPLAGARVRPAPRRRSPPKMKRHVRWIVGAGVLVVAIVAAALLTALGVVRVPGFSFLEGRLGGIPDPPLSLAGPQPNEPVLRYSLELFRYGSDELGDALGMWDALRDREKPGLFFALVPEAVGEETTWVLLAGPATDFVELENLKGPLSEIFPREDPDAWLVRETPRAFYLGERETLLQAQEYASSVEGNGVYAYILYVTYPNNTEAYEILAGAYRGVTDARPLQMILRRNGFRDAPLIERRGRLPE